LVKPTRRGRDDESPVAVVGACGWLLGSASRPSLIARLAGGALRGMSVSVRPPRQTAP
jgi:hypothetical protein